MKAPTQIVEIQGIEIAIPVGPIKEPTDEAKRIMKASQDPSNWKLPVSPYHTYDKKIADDLAECYDFFCGGHELEAVEWTKRGTLYRVSSKGYYFYVGS